MLPNQTNPTTRPTSMKWTAEELRLINAVNKYQHNICSPNYKGPKKDLDRIWCSISDEVSMSVFACRQRWSKIKNRYIKKLSNNEIDPNSKFMDGRLSFLDQHYGGQTKASSVSSEKHDVVIIESDEEIGYKKEFVVLDLDMIDSLLAKRGPEDIEMTRMEEILSLVSKRIDETLALNQHLNQVNLPEEDTNSATSTSVIEPETTSCQTANVSPIEVESPDVIELDDGSPAPQSPPSEDMDIEIISDNFQNAIVAFPKPSQDKTANVANTSTVPVASMAISVQPKPTQKAADDMETVFDIHRRSDTKTFFEELGFYMNRFSKEKQDEIRLKICCVVTEVELEEID